MNALLFGVLLLLSAGCSTRKNSAGTRFYHALTTRYNVYHNGHEAYQSGVRAQQAGNRDNHAELLPLYPIGNKATTAIGTSDYERAIEKAQKAIRQHSIKRRPARRPGKAYTEEYKQWLKRREFNPFLYRAWLLLGKAQYGKGAFDEAAATFSYTARLYQGQHNIVAEALIWLARCYSALGWNYDAEDALARVNNDSLPPSLATEYASAQGNQLLMSGRLREAIPHIERTARREKNKHRKARTYYLLGQLYQVNNQPTEAYEAYAHVIRLSPPYELSLNARIRQSEVLPVGEGERAVKKLLRMSREEKNKEYLDQIHYALGNVYLHRRDTVEALRAYRTGAQLSIRNGVEKGVQLLTLGDLCWQRGEFPEARKAYTEAIGLLDKEHRKYAETTRRSQILDALVPHVEAIALQDSLQHLVSLPEAERMAIIEQRIAEVIAQEEREREAAKEAERSALRQQTEERNAGMATTRPATTPTVLTPTVGGKQAWYFYNPQLVEQGKAQFIQQWGKRKLEDNWRRRNKTVLPEAEGESEAAPEAGSKVQGEAPTKVQPTAAATESEAEAEAASKTQPAVSEATPEAGSNIPDSIANDPHHPAYYLRQLPLTAEALAASNALLAEALFQAGKVYREQMEDLPRAEACLSRLIEQHPDYAQTDEALYQLFLLHLAADYRQTKPRSALPLQRAEACRQQLIERFPQSRYTALVSNPDYMGNARYGRQREDSLYARAYEDYRHERYDAVHTATQLSTERYPTGRHRAKFLFIDAAAHLQQGDQQAFLDGLKAVVQQYPEHETADLAAHMLKGVQEGRLLAEGSGSLGSIWQRRSTTAAAQGNLMDSTATVGDVPVDSMFLSERRTPYLFLLAYEAGSVDEKTLLYEVARYNFATFLVKNFDLSFTHERGIGMLVVSPFRSYDEALQYRRRLYADPHMAERLSGLRALLISEENYERLLNRYSFDDYDAFFRRHLSTVPEPELEGYTLDEPLQNLPAEDQSAPQDADSRPESVEEEENGVIFED